RDTARLKLDRTTSMVRMHYQPGQCIVEQGDVGSRFFLIVQGKVEVVRIEPGGAENRLNELGPGEYFGEMALLRGTRRNATVRAATPVDLLTMERADFMALATHGPFFKERLDALMAERLAEPAQAPAPVEPRQGG